MRVRSAAVIPLRAPGRPPRSRKVPKSREKCTPAPHGNPIPRSGARFHAPSRPTPTHTCEPPPPTHTRKSAPHHHLTRAEPPPPRPPRSGDRHPGPPGATAPPAAPRTRQCRAKTFFIKAPAWTRSPKRPPPPGVIARPTRRSTDHLPPTPIKPRSRLESRPETAPVAPPVHMRPPGSAHREPKDRDLPRPHPSQPPPPVNSS